MRKHTREEVGDMSHDEVDAIWVALHASETVTPPDHKVLGLDLGTRFGFCVSLDNGRILESGWYDTKRPGESEGMGRLRFKKVLHELLDTFEPDVVYYEKPGVFRGHGGKVIARQIGILEAELEERLVPYGSVHLATLKKFATGKGNASKDDMKEALANKLQS